MMCFHNGNQKCNREKVLIFAGSNSYYIITSVGDYRDIYVLDEIGCLGLKEQMLTGPCEETSLCLQKLRLII